MIKVARIKAKNCPVLSFLILQHLRMLLEPEALLGKPQVF